MVQPYLTPSGSFTNAILAGLRAKAMEESMRPKASMNAVFDAAEGRGGLDKNDVAPYSPEDRAIYRNSLMQEEANKEVVQQKKLRTQEITTDLMDKGLRNVVKYAPALNQSNYRDWYNWIQESDFLPSKMFTSPDVVENYSPEQFQIYKDKISAFKDPNPKMLDYTMKLLEAERKEKGRIEDLATKKEANRIAQERLTGEQQKSKEELGLKKEAGKREDETMFLNLTGNIFKKDKKGYESLATDKEGTAAYVDAYNELAKKLGKNTRIVWSDNPVYKQEGTFRDSQVPGYITVDVGKTDEQVAPQSAATALPNPGDQLTQDQITGLKEAAQSLISKGAPRDKILARLKEYGIEGL